MAGATGKGEKAQDLEVIVITPRSKGSRISKTSQEKVGRGVSTGEAASPSSQDQDGEDDPEFNPNNGDDRPSDDDYSEQKKSKRDREDEKAKIRLSWVKEWKWKDTPCKQRELSFNEYWDMIVLRDKEIERLRETIRVKSKRIATFRDGKVKGLNNRLKGKNSKLGEVQREKDSQKQELREVRNELEKMKGEVDAKEIAISGMTAERLNLLDKSDMPFLPDDVVTASFTKLFRETREWVKKWTVADWSEVQPKHAQQVCNTLSQNMPKEFASEDTAKAVLKGKIPPRVVLLAIVNVTLCRRTFMRPFDLIKTDCNEDASARGKDRLQIAFNYLKKHTASAFHRFRALSLLAYSPQDENALQLSGEGHPPRLNNLVDWSSDEICQRVLQETDVLAATRNETKTAARKQELMEITKRFIRAAISLLAQYPWLELRFRSRLMNVGFELEHPLFTWHRALKLKEADDDEEDNGPNARPDAHQAGIAGKQLDLVIEPTVLRHGEKDGTGYENERVLIKANVWGIKPEEFEGKSKVGSALEMCVNGPDAVAGNVPVAAGGSNPKSADKAPSKVALSDVAARTSERNAAKGCLPHQIAPEPAGSSHKQIQVIKDEPHIKEDSDTPLSALPTTRSRKRATEGKEPAAKKQRTSPAADGAARRVVQTTEGSTIMNPIDVVTERHVNLLLDRRGNKGKGDARTSRRQSDFGKATAASYVKETRQSTPERAKSESPNGSITTPPLNPKEYRRQP